MTLKHFIRTSLEFSTFVTMKLADDLRDAPLTLPTPRGGNHPLWVVGHIALAERQFIGQFSFGIPSPYGTWDGLFGQGTEPVTDPAAYPDYDIVLNALKATRDETFSLLNTLSDADFSRPSSAPPELRVELATIGDCFKLAIFHAAIHSGQLTDARRALARTPVVVPDRMRKETAGSGAMA